MGALGTILALSATIAVTTSIECYTGLKLITGQSVGTTTIQCENSQAYCYNMTANAAVVIDVVKAGCSMWRCMLARDKCISTTFQNIPISLCCCSSDRCNVGENGVGGGVRQESVGGWNAEPEQPLNMKQWTQDEVAQKFNSMEVDDDDESIGSTGQTTERQTTERQTTERKTTADFPHRGARVEIP